MEICRACLLTQKDMIALDEFCVTNYNLLTNLQINLGDEMPQFFCQNCFNMVKVFTDFREKAISSESSLREIIEDNKPDKLFDDDKYTDSSNIKTEMSDADHYAIECEVFDDVLFSGDVYDNESCENKLDVKCQLQCGLCKGDFVDEVAFLSHLTLHKRGGRCKICFEKLKIADLYAHALTHLQSTAMLEDETEPNAKVKLEPDNGDFTPSAVARVEKKERKAKTRNSNSTKGSQKAESATKFKKKSKSVESEALLSCGLCKMLFDCRELLVKHLDIHKADAGCKVCLETCSSWPQLFGHRMTHLPQKQRHCHMCKYWNISPGAMEFHYKTKHYDGEDKSLKCKQCYRSFVNPRRLSRHVVSVHGEKKYICDYCSKGFTCKPHLRSHIASHLQIRPYVCDLCGYASKLSTGLRSHTLRKHDPRGMVCKMCSAVFIDQDKYDRHNCNPTSVVCPDCGKEFATRKLLHRHMQSHGAARAHRCPLCPAAYRARGNLRVHLDRHAGRRSQRCAHCDARFYSRNVLLKHIRTHTGEKPYVCKICNKGFTGNHNLKVHMRIHGEDLIVKKIKTPQEPSPFDHRD